MNDDLARTSLATMFALAVAGGGGQAAAATINAASCSQSAVQTAINSAADGDTVIVPNGACTWTTPVSIAGKGVHLKGATKGGVEITHSAGQSDLIGITPDATHSVEVSNLRFIPGTVSAGGSGPFYISVNGIGKPVLIHDNYIRPKHFVVSCIHWGARGGVVWNNEFEALEPDGVGSGCIPIKAETPEFDVSWSTASTFGARDVNGDQNVYFEDNTFKKILLQAFDPDGNARVVIRYNTFDNSGMASHGADTGPDGVRHVEVYNNSFTFTATGSGYNYPLPLNYWMYIRGGSWVITDNVFANIQSQMWGDKSELVATVQNIRRRAGPYPCWQAYPAPRQFGQGHDGSRTVTEPSYIWNNTGGGIQSPSVDNYNPDECGTNLQTTSFIQQGRDYFVGVAKPGYSKYAYPHPLRAGTASGTNTLGLSAPANLRLQ